MHTNPKPCTSLATNTEFMIDTHMLCIPYTDPLKSELSMLHTAVLGPLHSNDPRAVAVLSSLHYNSFPNYTENCFNQK